MADSGKIRSSTGRFQKGNPGKPKGARNKTSKQLAEDILEAYEKKGGVAWLARLPDKLFCQVIGKLVPTEFRAEIIAARDKGFWDEFDADMQRMGEEYEAFLKANGKGGDGRSRFLKGPDKGCEHGINDT